MLLLIFTFGVIFWTLTEYLLHRFLGHVHKGKNFFKAEHGLHHSRFNYFAPVYIKAAGALFFFIVLFVLISVLVPKIMALAFLIGFFGMAGLYELTHFRFHSTQPLAMPFIILRKHHFYHHFHDPKTNFGVTTRFWDRVFGTFTAVEKVTVPQKMAMPWLLEEDEIKDAFSPHFCFAGKR